jgi:hypothetical protein
VSSKKHHKKGKINERSKAISKNIGESSSKKHKKKSKSGHKKPKGSQFVDIEAE